MRFGDKDWLHHLQRAAQDWKFHATLKPRIDVAVEDWHATQPPDMPAPVIEHHPIDPETQTGDSRLLGGPISIHSPWSHD